MTTRAWAGRFLPSRWRKASTLLDVVGEAEEVGGLPAFGGVGEAEGVADETAFAEGFEGAGDAGFELFALFDGASFPKEAEGFAFERLQLVFLSSLPPSPRRATWRGGYRFPMGDEAFADAGGRGGGEGDGEGGEGVLGDLAAEFDELRGEGETVHAPGDVAELKAERLLVAGVIPDDEAKGDPRAEGHEDGFADRKSGGGAVGVDRLCAAIAGVESDVDDAHGGHGCRLPRTWLGRPACVGRSFSDGSV